ncbi:hypothetical protein DFH08DRAFT_979148 [Mycena albidolilacea]|uniref:Uncharacterized protein n=1 Tax=Mycena albidolilacea TaxID=1033008 RepID=A0AAD6YX93_9AGAR|nr:hypothetical protein DFH08DRAFT_979148 [Mycena albidolilacea]
MTIEHSTVSFDSFLFHHGYMPQNPRSRRYWTRIQLPPTACDGKAIEGKYKTLLKTKKPTSDAHCPPEIKRAHQIESLINEKADTREISNNSF